MRLLLLHGFCGSPEIWRKVRSALPKGFAIEAPVLGGHLGTPPPRSFEEEVDRVAGLAFGSEPVTICGYSLGGRIALGLLDRHPGAVARLILVGANPGLSSDDDREVRAAEDEKWAACLEREGVRGFLERWEALPLFATQARLPADVRDEQRADRDRHDARSLAGAMRALGLARMPSYWSTLARTDAPIDFVAGAEDSKFTALGERVAKIAKRARLVTVAGAGHNVALEAPGAVVDVIGSAS